MRLALGLEPIGNGHRASERYGSTMANERVYTSLGGLLETHLSTNDLGVVPMGYHPVNLTGLSLTTTYYFQAHAENSYGSVSSAVTSFSTIGTIAEWTSIADGMWTNPATWNVPGVPRAGAPVTVNHAVTLDVATPELSSVTVNVGKTLTFDGWDTVLTADTVTISGTVTHVQNTDTNGIDGWTPDARVNIVCEDLTIGADGGIDVRGKGFKGGVYPQHGNGPGGGVPRSTVVEGLVMVITARACWVETIWLMEA